MAWHMERAGRGGMREAWGLPSKCPPSTLHKQSPAAPPGTGARRHWKEPCRLEGRGGGLRGLGAVVPREGVFAGALRTGAHRGHHFAAAPKSTAVLWGFASPAHQLPLFFDSEAQLLGDSAAGAGNATLHGLRTTPGAESVRRSSFHVHHWDGSRRDRGHHQTVLHAVYVQAFVCDRSLLLLGEEPPLPAPWPRP